VNRSLAIIMLDFFIMMAIAFFVFQFIQSDNPNRRSRNSNGTVITVRFDRTEYEKAHGLGSVPMSGLIELGSVLESGGRPVSEESAVRVVTYDSLHIVYLGRDDGPLTVKLYARRVHSFDFIASHPDVFVTAIVHGKEKPIAPLHPDFTRASVVTIAVPQ
jgi:hypothetical protein